MRIEKESATVLIGVASIFILGVIAGYLLCMSTLYSRHIAGQIRQMAAASEYYEKTTKLLKEFYKSGKGREL